MSLFGNVSSAYRLHYRTDADPAPPKVVTCEHCGVEYEHRPATCRNCGSPRFKERR